MAISVICAWIAVLALVLTASKYVVKKNKKVNWIFRKIHIPAGIVLIVAGLVHGLLAGNRLGASLSEISIGSELFTSNPGTLCFILAIALGLTYCFRWQLKKYWMKLHRILTALILLALVVHVAQVGITLPEVLRGGDAQQVSAAQAVETEGEEDTPATVPETTVSTNETEAAAESGTAAETEGASDAPAASETPAASESGSSTNTASDTTVTAEVSDEADQGLPEELDVTFSGATLTDGTYEGSAEGYKSTIQVSVTVEGGAVTSIDIVSENETPKYWSRAEGLTDTIVSEQFLEVDAVSGATYSSKGILCAVYDALEEAVSDGELKITIPEPKGRKH